ncbi:MAG: 30S ribosomal protein S6 [Thermodesulfobacteriota bacterium]
MRRYETILIARPSIGEEPLTGLQERVAGIIGAVSGEVLKAERWGLKKLAYPIRKQSQGIYVYTQYTGQPETVAEIERILKIDDQVLKFLTVKLQDRYVPDPPAPEVEAPAETEAGTEAEAAGQESVTAEA